MSETCTRCGTTRDHLGASINGKPYCHTWDNKYPTCYMLAGWEQTTGVSNPPLGDMLRALDRLALHPLEDVAAIHNPWDGRPQP